MSVKGRGFMLAMMTMAMMGDSGGHRYIEPKETKEEQERRLAIAERERNIRNGLTEYHYANGSLWALNQTSADKKAKKKGWI